MCFYILGYTLELNSVTPTQIEFWNQVEYVGIPFVSALWLTTALLYTGHFTHHKKILIAAIYLIPIITMILRFTNNYHHMYFSSLSYVAESGKLLFVKKMGPWMCVQAVHSMGMIVIAMALFIRDAIISRDKRNGKIILMAVASIFAITGLLLAAIKPFTFYIDYMALCLPVTCVMVILSIAYYDLLGTKSIARSRTFEYRNDAVILISRQNRVLDFNSSAKQLFEKINIRLYNGYIFALFEKSPQFLEALNNTEKTLVKLPVHDEKRCYEITTMNIDERSSTRGWIKTIRDITEIYQLNEELKRQALTDELSELYNRRAFIQLGNEWVTESDENGSSLHLVMLDLDSFKNVNDQYGHPAGDYVIRHFSRMLISHFITGSLVARLGG